MMVIPAIDLIQGRCVRLFQGDYNRQSTYGTDPAAQARLFEKAGFERLHVIDLEGARDGSHANRCALLRIREETRLPLQTGGGIRSAEDVDELLQGGIDHLIVGTALLERPDEVEGWIQEHGPESFIAGLDLRGDRLQVRGWCHSSPVSLEEAAGRLAVWGVRHVICTDVSSDGTLGQPNYALCKRLSGLLAEGTRIIAAGGVSRPEQIPQLKESGAWGAVVGRALYEGSYSLEDWANAV